MPKILTLLLISGLFVSCSRTSIETDPVPLVETPHSVNAGGFPTYEVTHFQGKALDTTHYDFPLTENKAVQKWIKFFTQTKKGRQYFTMYMLRGSKYVPFIQEKLRAQNMPEDLAYLALIESGFSNYARSHAAAVGLWQFIPATGRRYGLDIDLFRDERRNPEKATAAALRYLQDLYQEFEDWPLAIAAYNCGEERIRMAIIETGTRDYWHLVEKGKIPKETRNYVPKMTAAILLAKNPNSFPIVYRPLEKESAVEDWTNRDPNFQYFNEPLSTIALTSPLDLIKYAQSLDMTLTELKIYNPELVGWFTPESYELKVPTSKVELAASLSFPEFEPDFFIYQVKKGASLKQLSRQFNVSEDAILMFNPTLAAGQVLSKGAKLVMPLPSERVSMRLGLEANSRKRIRY